MDTLIDRRHWSLVKFDVCMLQASTINVSGIDLKSTVLLKLLTKLSSPADSIFIGFNPRAGLGLFI